MGAGIGIGVGSWDWGGIGNRDWDWGRGGIGIGVGIGMGMGLGLGLGWGCDSHRGDPTVTPQPSSAASAPMGWDGAPHPTAPPEVSAAWGGGTQRDPL